MAKVIIAFLVLLTASPSVSAKLFKCTDGEGVVIFSDIPCETGAKEVKGLFVSNTGNKNDDKAIQNCIDFLGRNVRIRDSDGVKVQSHSYDWVSVKDIGARRMLHLMVNVKNQYGAYDGAESMQCLLMGDGITVNLNEYELIE